MDLLRDSQEKHCRRCSWSLAQRQILYRLQTADKDQCQDQRRTGDRDQRTRTKDYRNSDPGVFEKLKSLKAGDVLVLAGSIPSTLPENIYEWILMC